MNRNKVKIQQIDALRGIAAVLVVLFHMIPFFNYIHPNSGAILNGGSYLGVSVFFIISGFVMGVATINDGSVKNFLLSRVFRVYAPTIIAAFLYCIIINKKINPLDLFLLIPDGGPAPYYGYGVYFITWTLTYEIAFYLIYAISMLISWKRRSEVALLIIVFNCVVLQLILVKGFSVGPGAMPQIAVFNSPKANSLLSILINPINLLFCMGIVWFKFKDEIEDRIRKIKIGALVSTLMVAMAAVGVGYVTVSGHGILQMGLFSFLLFSAVMVLHFISDRKDPGLIYRFVIYLGKISFSLYLCHYLAIELRVYYLPAGISVVWHPFIVLFFVALISFIFYNLVDLPSSKLGRFIQLRFSGTLVAR